MATNAVLVVGAAAVAARHLCPEAGFIPVRHASKAGSYLLAGALDSKYG